MEETDGQHYQPQLSQPEIDAIIEAAYRTRDRSGLREASEAVRRLRGRRRNRHTMERHFYTVLELIARGLDTEDVTQIDDATTQEIADSLRTWNVSAVMVSRHWQSVRLWRASHIPVAVEDTGGGAHPPPTPAGEDAAQGAVYHHWRDILWRFRSWRFATVTVLVGTVVAAAAIFGVRELLNAGEDDTPPLSSHTAASPVQAEPAPPEPPFPLSVSFDSWEPSEPVLAHIWNEVELSFQFTNTSEHPWEFFAAATLRRPDGRQDHLAPLRPVNLEPGEQGVARWVYTVEQIGEFDVIYGVWAFAGEGKEPESRVGNNGWQSSHLLVYEGCPTTPDARIFGFSPFNETHVLAGGSLTLSMDLRNTGVVSQKFVAGASVVDTDENLVGNYDTVLEDALAPGQTATIQWEHVVAEPGNYLVQFGVWERPREGLIYRAPCPMERLIMAHPPGMPLVKDVALEVPRRGPEDQSITITGENLKPYSAVILRFMASEYPVDAERVEYRSPKAIRVRESLTVPGTWQVQVVNSAEERSNWLGFRVLP